MTRGHFVRLAVVLIALPMASISRSAAGDDVPRWEPHDFTFDGGDEPANPFRVDLNADLVGPGGLTLRVPGFYDGARTWKVRAAPLVEGEWSLTTRSDLARLDGQRRTFRCVRNPSSAVHGGLRVDSEHRTRFVYEDGTPFFPLGYECDWLWALDADRPELPTLGPFLDKLTSNGFNYVMLNAFAHDTTWRKGRTGADDFGPPPRFAWEGTNEKPDHTRFNLAYWRHYDRVIDALYRRGIVAHLMIKVYNKAVNWPARGSTEDDLYFRWLIARYAAYPNRTWDFSKEANNETDVNYKLDRLRFIRQNDPYHRLLTVHDDKATYDRGAYDDLLDYRSDQQHSKWREVMFDHRRRRDWPVINTEFGYEHGPGGLNDKTYRVVQTPEEVCRRAWEVTMAGGFPVYYYTYTAWDVIRPEDTPPGYAYFRHLRAFFEGTGYWRMRPVEGISSAGYCLAEPGREYIVFLDKAAPFTLKLEELSQPLHAQWYQPYTGERRPAGTLSTGTADLKPPADWVDVPVALHVGDKP